MTTVESGDIDWQEQWRIQRDRAQQAETDRDRLDVHALGLNDDLVAVEKERDEWIDTARANRERAELAEAALIAESSPVTEGPQ